jgi:hypothetical protein
LILLHRLRTLDIEAIEEYPDKSFNAKKFFFESSRPLTFRDVDGWDVDSLARDLRTLVTADKPGQLLALKPQIDPGQFGTRDEAHLAVMKVVLDAVFAVTSLGSPIVVEDDTQTPIVRSGYWIAPLGTIVTHEDSLQKLLSDEETRNFQMAVNGFIDLRPVAIAVREARSGAARDPAPRRTSRSARLASLEPLRSSRRAGSSRSSIAPRSRHAARRRARDLGTMQDWV